MEDPRRAGKTGRGAFAPLWAEFVGKPTARSVGKRSLHVAECGQKTLTY